MGAKNKSLTFAGVFAPQEGLVASPERKFREELCLNGAWQFQPMALPSSFKQGSGVPPELPLPAPKGWDKTPLRVPSPWNSNDFSPSEGGDFRCFPSYPKAWEKVEMGWLKKSFKVPGSWKGKRLILHFEAVAGQVQVLFNGQKVAEHFDLFLPFEADVTDQARFDGPNELLVGVRKASLWDQPGPTGKRPYPYGSFWGSHIAGIWQDVFLLALPPVRVTDIFIRPLLDRDLLEAQVRWHNDTASAVRLSARGRVFSWKNLAKGSTTAAPEPSWKLGPAALDLPVGEVEVPAKGEAVLVLKANVDGLLDPWTPEASSLYGLVLETLRDGKALDAAYQRFGWRQLTFDGGRQLLNNRPLELRGDSWHFLGIPQMTRRYAWAWFKALKEANANAVRFHAQPYPRFYLDLADEMGIMVLDESAIWASDGQPKFDSPDWFDRCRNHLQDLVLRDRNHPCVFGWSVSNEVTPILNIVKASPELSAQVRGEYSRWRDLVRSQDPTRPWISSDGDEDVDGRLSAVVGHYGDENAAKNWSGKAKPWGIGETGMAYYATPRQVSAENGARAYESQLGRMEGLAVEAWRLIAMQRRMNASYCSVFNIAWYGLMPLELGLKDTSRPPELEDGVFFGPLVEGRPGVQPERLGPYCSTFNPGYDPSLPLYKPWPLFEAIKAAFAPAKPAACAWDHRPLQKKQAAPSLPEPEISRVEYIGDTSSAVYGVLWQMGMPLNTAAGPKDLLIVDGMKPLANPAKAGKRVKEFMDAGGSVLVWCGSREAMPSLNKILPARLELTDRQAASLAQLDGEPLASGLTLADLDFAELEPKVILPCGLAGPLARKGRTVLEASNTDWRRWNNQAEMVKTIGVLRSEREAKPSGAALLDMRAGKGRLVVAALAPGVLASTDQRLETCRRLMANLGVRLNPMPCISGGLFTHSGILQKALVLGSFKAASYEEACKTGFLDPSQVLKAAPGAKMAGKAWASKSTNGGGFFNLLHLGMPGPDTKCAAYFSFWISCPRPLDELLAQPDVPSLNLVAGSDDGMQVWLNGKSLFEDHGTHSLNPDSARIPLPLKLGWNNVLVKVSQNDGEWQFAARLECDRPEFLTSLQSSLSEPQ